MVYDSFFCMHARKSRAVFEIIHMKKLFVFLLNSLAPTFVTCESLVKVLEYTVDFYYTIDFCYTINFETVQLNGHRWRIRECNFFLKLVLIIKCGITPNHIFFDKSLAILQ